MDLDQSSAYTGIKIICPHCNAVEIDDLELLSLDEMNVITCDACRSRFHLTIAECETCGEESVLTWAAVPMPDQIRFATCLHCANRLNDHGDYLRPMG